MGNSASSSKNSDSSRLSKLNDALSVSYVSVSKRGTGTFDIDLKDFKPYMQDQMKVVRVSRYLEPMKAQGYGFGHEFLVLDSRTPRDAQILIRAEKDYAGIGDTNNQPGGRTRVSRISDPPMFTMENEKNLKYDLELQGSGKILMKILMKDLIKLLEASNPGYSLWKHNCWKYAYDTPEKLLKVIAGLPDTSDECKRKIREALENLPRPSLPAEIIEEAVVFLLGITIFNLHVISEKNEVPKGLNGSSLPMKSPVSGLKNFLNKRYASMKEKHYVPQQRDENLGIQTLALAVV